MWDKRGRIGEEGVLVLVKGELRMKGGGTCGRIGEEGVLVLVKGELRMKGGGACGIKEGGLERRVYLYL